jgi:hypothetical protein
MQVSVISASCSSYRNAFLQVALRVVDCATRNGVEDASDHLEVFYCPVERGALCVLSGITWCFVNAVSTILTLCNTHSPCLSLPTNSFHLNFVN